MTQQKRQGEQEGGGEKRSKYFSIDSYFKSPIVNKKIKLTPPSFDQQVDQAIELSLKPEHILNTVVELKKEQCPICQAFIFIESVSMEVHVNACLDSQQKEESSTSTHSWKDKFTCLEDNKKEEEPLVKYKKEIEAINDIKEEPLVKYKEEIEAFNDIKEELECFFDSKEDISSDEETQKENIVTEEKGVLRRLLPNAWKSLFTANDTPISLPLDVKNVNTNMSKAKGKQKKPCPFYKRVRDTRFTVDAFNYGKISECDGYFLTHYHSDHYGGLRKSWSHGPIYCSQVTANLVKQELGVHNYYIRPLPMNELCPIEGTNITIGLIDANHCPGSVLFLFIIDNKDGTKTRHLHTGDFRASPRMCLHPFIKQPENGPIHCLYLDTTYLNPQYAFPAQEECIKAVCDLVKVELQQKKATKEKKSASILENWIVQKSTKKSESPMIDNALKSRVLIVVGTYTIGKERVFFNIAKMLKCKIYAQTKKKRILKCQQDKELDSMLTNDPMEAQVHVVSLRDIRADIMSRYLDDHKSNFDSLIAFKPTGWTYKSTKVETSDMTLAPLSHIIIPPIDRSIELTPYYDNKNMKFYGVPYSEHSSFRELASFIASLDIKNIIPTVNIGKIEDMSKYYKKWQEEKMSKRIEVVSYPTEDHW